WIPTSHTSPCPRCPLLQDTCAICQQLFTFLQRASNQSAVQVVAQQLLRALCLPLSILALPCQALVHTLVPRLLWELQHLVPQQICANLKLCQGEPGGAPAVPLLGALSTHPQPPAPGAALALPVPLPLCWLCRRFVAQAE
ncbi:PSPB protein, partial [Smithornis capensis]|nr:PSPB protein [Smithornis capensis]